MFFIHFSGTVPMARH